MASVHLHGTPHKLDLFLRPPVRVFQLVVGLGLAVPLALLGLWWWVPLPVVLSFLAYEVFFWWRGDRRCTLELGPAIRWSDPVQGVELVLDPAAVEVAVVIWRPAQSPGLVMARVLLGDDRGVTLAMRLQLRAPYTPAPTDLDGLFLDAVVGAGAGPMHHLAPAAVTCRQVVYDPDGSGLGWLRAHLPPGAWERTAARVWRGDAPPLDLLGTHEGAPDGWLILDGREIRVRLGREARTAPLGPVAGGRSERPAALVDLEGGRQRVDLPMVVFDLGPGVQVACPSPLVGTLGEEVELGAETLHTHAAEGELVVWHLLTRLPRSEWPPHLVQAVAEARVEVELPTGLQ